MHRLFISLFGDLIMNVKLLVTRLELAIGFANANIYDVLDERNEKNYWEGYRDALIEIKDKLKD